MPEIDSIIVRNIDLLESAINHATTNMDEALAGAVGELIEEKRVEFGWTGIVGDDFEDDMKVAPSEWHTEGGGEGDHDLYIEFDETGEGNFSWVANFAGASGAGIHFAIRSKAVSPARLRKILRAEAKLVEELHTRGFSCDPQGDLSIPITIPREALANAFLEEDFKEALAPIGQALDRIHEARDLLDQLVAAIRAHAGGG